MSKHVQQCILCSQNVRDVDYKSVDLLKRFVSAQAKIIDPRHTGTCVKHQRSLARAIKRARFLGLLPFVRT